MGYSRSTKTLQSRMALIEPLASGGGVTWETEPGEEHKLAYKIREALRVARHHADEYPKFAALGERYRISIQGPGRVVAQEINPTAQVKVIVPGADRLSGVLPQAEGPTTATQIIQSVLDQPREGLPPKLNFPNAKLREEEKVKLYNWCHASGWLMFVADSGITLQLFDAELAEFAFNPEVDL